MKNRIAKEQIKKLIDVSCNTVKALVALSVREKPQESILREYFINNIETLKKGPSKNDKRVTSSRRKRRKRTCRKI